MTILTSDAPKKRTRGPGKKRPIVEFPEPLWTQWEDPADFGSALRLHIKRHGDTVRHLYMAITSNGGSADSRAFMRWIAGTSAPRGVGSMDFLARIERRYRLADGYFKSKLAHTTRAAKGIAVPGRSAAERRRLAWHLPDDFATRSKAEQDQILDWVTSVIIRGSTDYRRYQAEAMKHPFSLRFASAEVERMTKGLVSSPTGRLAAAPPSLLAEMEDLLRIKTSTLAAFGVQRNGVWNSETASQKVEHLALFFGALAADPAGPNKGLGCEPSQLCFGLLVFPQIWDWYLQWRENRRRFFTAWEVDMLSVMLSLVRQETGWLRQSPYLARRLQPVDGLVSERDIERTEADWDAACDTAFKHGRKRIKELQRVVRVHRDPFEPILPVLEAASPLGQYRLIADEIWRSLPSATAYPKARAEALRSFLMIRFGLHLGLRQRNLRELLLCPRGRLPSSERFLEDHRRGELRWNSKDHGWEVFIPAVAFKNADSSFFGSKPFRLMLPDFQHLYEAIDIYIERDRAKLLGPASDPGTFFVKSAKTTTTTAAYDQNSFYEAWRLIIQRYGIYNPYTKRGAIEGLLPHGPHNVRDVLATHILKQTGSYEQASYAIQDTPDMVAKHYGRFLPQDKSAIAAQVLNKVWAA